MAGIGVVPTDSSPAETLALDDQGVHVAGEVIKRRGDEVLQHSGIRAVLLVVACDQDQLASDDFEHLRARRAEPVDQDQNPGVVLQTSGRIEDIREAEIARDLELIVDGQKEEKGPTRRLGDERPGISPGLTVMTRFHIASLALCSRIYQGWPGPVDRARPPMPADSTAQH